MVRLNIVNLVQMKIKRIAHARRGPFYNHRVPLEYQRFQKRIVPEEIVERYSQDKYSQQKQEDGQHSVEIANNFFRTSLLGNLTTDDLRKNQIFQDEFDRQRALVARIEKIKVVIDSEPGKGKTFMMNKNISTPFECAQHINELLVTRSAIAELLPLDEDSEPQASNPESYLVQPNDDRTNEPANRDATLQGDGRQKPTKRKTIYWDMHRPLDKPCMIRFRHFEEEDVHEINKAYWRSCSFLLGIAIRRAFKDGVKVMLHSWPKPDIRSGSFVYDVAINLNKKWTPSDQELRAFSKLLWDICGGNYRFERLTTSPETAMLMFDDNNFKLQQIQAISQKNQERYGSNKIDLYRCGGYVDISIGPMISHTGQVGRISLAAVHQLDHHIGAGELDAAGLFYRFQGVSLPKELLLNPFVYQNVLLNRAKKLNHCHEIND